MTGQFRGRSAYPPGTPAAFILNRFASRTGSLHHPRCSYLSDPVAQVGAIVLGRRRDDEAPSSLQVLMT